MDFEKKYFDPLELDTLTFALDDPDASVRQVTIDAIDRLVATEPEALAWLMERVNDEEGSVGLARYLVHVGTPDAIEAALPTIAGDTWGEERVELLELLAGAKGLTDERLRALLDEGPRNDDMMHRTAAEILGLRGFAAGYRALFRSYGGRRLYDEFIARGRDGIRVLCCAFPDHDATEGAIAERLAAQRKKTESVVHELLADPTSGGLRTAIEVLGYWDEPRNVDLLMEIAQGPRRDRRLREEAILSLCRLEAPEALDLLIRTLLDTAQVDGLRWSCADALGAIGKPDALEALESVARNDPDETMRRYAAHAIEDIQSLAA